jgi:hypothetical protein
MGYRKLSPHANGRPRLAGACLIALLILAFLAPSFDLQSVAAFPTAACSTSDDEPPDALIFLQEPLSDDDNPCALWEGATDIDTILLVERAPPESLSPSLSFSFRDPPAPFSRFKRLVSTPRSPPRFF